MPGTDELQYRNNRHLPVQHLLEGEYLRVTRLHKDLNDLSVIPHRHDHYELMFITAGEGSHSINFKQFEIKPHRAYFLHPGQVHLIKPFHRDGWLVMFGDELFKRFLLIHKHEDENGILNSYTSHPFVDLSPPLLTTTGFIIDELRRSLQAPHPDVKILLHYVSLLLLYLNNEHIVQHPQVQSTLAHKELFYQLKYLIEHNFKQQHLASYYETALRADIKKLNRICREATQMTVFELLQERLLTESKILLQTTVRSVKEISYDLGFNDPAFFGRFFKKHTGLTPAAFRSLRMI